MKCLPALALLAACSSSPSAAEQLPWLAGTWTLTDDSERRTEEAWSVTPTGDLVGRGHVVLPSDPSRPPLFGYVEALHVDVDDDGDLVYTRWPVGGAPTAYTAAEHRGQSVTFQGAAGADPSAVRYRLVGDVLEVWAYSGSEPTAEPLVAKLTRATASGSPAQP